MDAKTLEYMGKRVDEARALTRVVECTARRLADAKQNMAETFAICYRNANGVWYKPDNVDVSGEPVQVMVVEWIEAKLAAAQKALAEL